MFANGLGDLGWIPGRIVPKTFKMVLDTSLLNTQRYKVRIKNKMEQSRERSSVLPLHLGVVAIEKGAFWLLLTTVANFTYFIYLNRTWYWISYKGWYAIKLNQPINQSTNQPINKWLMLNCIVWKRTVDHLIMSKQMTGVKLNPRVCACVSHSNTWNHLTLLTFTTLNCKTVSDFICVYPQKLL